ncbi:MAG TPA: hypothetical protein VE129_06020 [Thermoanaerobaculia bacterium]|nr:hypothetical protein [Thermoanaerobaculia bacterium]
MSEMMTSGAPWDEVPSEHYRLMSAAAAFELAADPFLRRHLSRLLRIVLAALLAGSAILLAG